MKHILKFLGLKIVEVGGACAAWYGLSWLGHCVNVIISGSNPGRDDIVYTWILVPIFGVVSLVVPLTVAVIIVVMINGLIV